MSFRGCSRAQGEIRGKLVEEGIVGCYSDWNIYTMTITGNNIEMRTINRLEEIRHMRSLI